MDNGPSRIGTKTADLIEQVLLEIKDSFVKVYTNYGFINMLECVRFLAWGWEHWHNEINADRHTVLLLNFKYVLATTAYGIVSHNSYFIPHNIW